MTTRADYSDEEWGLLHRAPMVAGLAISLADPGGLIEFTKETMAAIRTMGSPPSDHELLLAISRDPPPQAELDEVTNDIGGGGARTRQRVLDELRRVNEILGAKATPEEAASFRVWLIQAAENAANAAKEGGFFGILAVQVSKREEDMLVQLREILGVEAS